MALNYNCIFLQKKIFRLLLMYIFIIICVIYVYAVLLIVTPATPTQPLWAIWVIWLLLTDEYTSFQILVHTWTLSSLKQNNDVGGSDIVKRQLF